ncbi:MAG: crotonase/enoyl-CoA hydratase family protein [Bacteroidota bacterium]
MKRQKAFASMPIEKEEAVRAVVLTGAGKAFCAGLDLSNFQNGDDAAQQPLITRTHGNSNIFQKVAFGWRELSVPVIGAIHGVSFGGGLQIMLGSDVKYITPDTKLSIMEMKWGLIPDMAGTQLMRHSVRDDIIRELTYTNRIFSGEEAVRFGFATHLSDNPLEDAMKLAREIASKSPTAVVKAKKLYNAAPYLSVEDGFIMESVEQDAVMKKKNQLEAVYASMQKRPGDFENYRE